MNDRDGETLLKRGRGRPKKEVTRDKIFGIRLDDEEERLLDYLESKSGESKSEIIRKAVRGYYAYLKEVGMIGEYKR